MDGIGHVNFKKTHIRIFSNENLPFLYYECKILRVCNFSFRNLKRCDLQTHSKIMANIRKKNCILTLRLMSEVSSVLNENFNCFHETKSFSIS